MAVTRAFILSFISFSHIFRFLIIVLLFFLHFSQIHLIASINIGVFQKMFRPLSVLHGDVVC